MLTGAFLYLPLVLMPEADSLKHPQAILLNSRHLANMKSIRKVIHKITPSLLFRSGVGQF
ncbi:hypothetical protein HUSEC41_06861 [Escherichia coli O104:H4 str. 01-09591]|nr:hypothetical protein HUSEC41_06861 [Escherichia coli O104:H4 str. 01-09591]